MLQRHAEKSVCITAPTGQAAQQIGGITYHSFMKWGPEIKKEGIKAIMNRAESGSCQKRIEKTDVLIIDEISMVENHMLARLNRAIQRARDEEAESFGGLQIIVSGDFLQLPPVKPFETCFTCGKEFRDVRRVKVAVRNQKVKQYECSTCENVAEFETEEWAFCSQIWESANFKNVHFSQNHQQS